MKTSDKMLIYKAWLETRGRFLAGLILLAGVAFYAVLRAPEIIFAREQFDSGEPLPYAKYIWILLYKGYFQTLWILSAVLLGMGGIWREKATGVAGFTLTLPVTRRRLVLVRSLVGAIEAASLAVIPSLIIWAASPLAGYSYPLKEAFWHALLILGGGLIFFAWGVVLSHLVQGEFSAPTIALGGCLVLFVVFSAKGVGIFNPFDLMSGKHYLDPATFMLAGSSQPWTLMGSYLIAAMVMIFGAVKIAEMRDF